MISLQGEAQAKLIERRLLEELDPEVIEERELICGDAYAFQGDERDVIFLSMVAAPNERIGVLSTDSARQRFNVAVSRAKDQLWLFHTASLDDLSPACMRHRLLGYMLNPARDVLAPSELHFESKFERHVYEHLAARGFRVRTQVAVGDRTNHRYRIDLVVEGMRGRLAVECDGDEWHGPDRYEHDAARQRDLERAGWQFVRLRGGEFYRDQAKAMERVWAQLEKLGIRSGGIDELLETPTSPTRPSPVKTSHLPAVPRFDLADSRNAEAETEAWVAGNAEETAVEEHEREQQDLASDGPSQLAVRPSAAPAPLPLEDVPLLSNERSPYPCFEGTGGPDPRTSNPSAIAQGLVRIIAVEGPMSAKRAYDIYLRGCGIRRLGGEIQRTMNRALGVAVKNGEIICEDEKGTGGFVWSIVRAKGTEAVRLRERGPRTFDEIPPSEMQLAARRVAQKLGVLYGSDAHLRATLEQFELVRLTAQVSEGLKAALTRRFPYVDELIGAD